jgi:tRNA (guanine37-N1)-methyltransferase
MRIDVLTLFPEMFESVLSTSILKRAADPALYVEDDEDTFPEPPPVRAPVSYHLHDIRHWTTDKHGKVDKAPFGGGPGMVMQCQPVWDTVQAVQGMDPHPPTRIFVTPQGRTLTQPLVEELAAKPRLMILCGHYEGVDERVIDRMRSDTSGGGLLEISIGDYVLSGGELAAMVLIDAVVRLIPGVLGDADSAHHESFSSGAEGRLDYPHYTKPREWAGMPVPDVLLSGDHARIAAWRAEQSRQRTAHRRPDRLPPTAS